MMIYHGQKFSHTKMAENYNKLFEDVIIPLHYKVLNDS